MKLLWSKSVVFFITLTAGASLSTGEGLVPEQADEAQADAAGGGGEGSAAGGRGEQELSPRQ